jgi:hypothetical protein
VLEPSSTQSSNTQGCTFTHGTLLKTTACGRFTTQAEAAAENDSQNGDSADASDASSKDSRQEDTKIAESGSKREPEADHPHED